MCTYLLCKPTHEHLDLLQDHLKQASGDLDESSKGSERGGGGREGERGEWILQRGTRDGVYG